MIDCALDHGDGAGIADSEALARHAAEVAFAFDGAVEHRVAHNDRLFLDDCRLRRRPDDES